MVSDTTWTAARAACLGRELGAVRVVGRQAPVRVHEIVGMAGEARPAWMAEFDRGLRSCRAGDWAAALAAFGRCPGDPPARMYAERCRKLLADPSAAWDAVWNLTEK